METGRARDAKSSYVNINFKGVFFRSRGNESCLEVLFEYLEKDIVFVKDRKGRYKHFYIALLQIYNVNPFSA